MAEFLQDHRGSSGRLRWIIKESKRRATDLEGPEAALDILAVEYVLLGLRYPNEYVRTLFPEFDQLRESSTYQAILEEGRVEALRDAILIVGESSLGPADESVRQFLESIREADQLKLLLRRTSSAGNWRELLNGPAASSGT